MLGRCSAGCLHQRLPTEGLSRVLLTVPFVTGSESAQGRVEGSLAVFFIGEVSKGPVF